MTRKIQSRSEKTVARETMAGEFPREKAGNEERSASGGAIRTITPEERHCMIAMAAYLIAEQRGFRGDAALDDWLQAEAEVDASRLRLG